MNRFYGRNMGKWACLTSGATMRKSLPNVLLHYIQVLLLLLCTSLFSGCGKEFREGYQAGAAGVTVGELRLHKAQAELMEIELRQRQRQQRAEENLPRFRRVVVPSLRPIAVDLIAQRQERDPHYQPGPEIIEEAAQIFNQQHPETPITSTDMDTLYLTDQGQMAFMSLKILPMRVSP